MIIPETGILAYNSFFGMLMTGVQSLARSVMLKE